MVRGSVAGGVGRGTASIEVRSLEGPAYAGGVCFLEWELSRADAGGDWFCVHADGDQARQDTPTGILGAQCAVEIIEAGEGNRTPTSAWKACDKRSDIN
jgi:hypothetical protein